MKVYFWPKCVPGREDHPAQLEKLLKNLRENDMQLYTLLREVLYSIVEASNIDHLELEGNPLVKPLVAPYPISELRVPPHRSKGVARIYFCDHPNERDTIVILDGELKKGRKQSKGDSNRIHQCILRYKEMFE